MKTPAVVAVADSVRELRVRVEGSGAVRLHFEGGTVPQDQTLPLWGRDVTLRRYDGQFQAVARAIPLAP